MRGTSKLDFWIWRRGLALSNFACIMVLCAVLLPSPAHAADGEQQFAELGQCKLESGQVIENCRVGYRTFGRLDSARDNAVLMPTWLYGRSADLVSLFGNGDASPHLVDTSRYFGIAIDALGDGVSSSPSISKTQHGPLFPQFTLREMHWQSGFPSPDRLPCRLRRRLS